MALSLAAALLLSQHQFIGRLGQDPALGPDGVAVAPLMVAAGDGVASLDLKVCGASGHAWAHQVRRGQLLQISGRLVEGPEGLQCLVRQWQLIPEAPGAAMCDGLFHGHG